MRNGPKSTGSIWPSRGGILRLGVAFISIVAGVTFFGLLASSQAMFGAAEPGIDNALEALMVEVGALPPAHDRGKRRSANSAGLGIDTS